MTVRNLMTYQPIKGYNETDHITLRDISLHHENISC